MSLSSLQDETFGLINAKLDAAELVLAPLGIWLENDAVIVKSADVFALSPRTTTEPGER